MVGTIRRTLRLRVQRWHQSPDYSLRFRRSCCRIPSPCSLAGNGGGSRSATFQTIDPGDGSPLASVAEGKAADVDGRSSLPARLSARAAGPPCRPMTGRSCCTGWPIRGPERGHSGPDRIARRRKPLPQAAGSTSQRRPDAPLVRRPGGPYPPQRAHRGLRLRGRQVRFPTESPPSCFPGISHSAGGLESLSRSGRATPR